MLLLLLGAFLIACDIPTGPLPPPDAVPFATPAAYQRWWSETETCSGLSGDLSSVAWSLAPSDSIVVDGEVFDGVWYPSGNRIVLARREQFDGPLVRHEMLHALMQRGGHPRALFVGRCAGILACKGECLSEEPPPPPDPGALPIEAMAMEVETDISNTAPSSTFEEGNFQLIVKVRNPRSTPVVIQLPGSANGGFLGAGYLTASRDGIISSGSSAYHETAPEARRFRAGETRTYLFDLGTGAPPDGVRMLSPGTYTFQGTFGGAVSAGQVSVTLLP